MRVEYINKCFEIRLLSHPSGSTPELIAQSVIAEKPDLCGFSATALTELTLIEAIRRIKDALPNTIIVIGGPSTVQSSTVSRFATSSADLFVHGEGEVSFANLVVALCENGINDIVKGQTRLRGISTRDMLGYASMADEICNLAEIASPYVNKNGFSFYDSLYENHDHLYWETARGCVYPCAYCAYSRRRRFFRCIPYERLQAEVRKFSSWSVKSIFITDPILGGPKPNTKRVLRLIAKIEGNPQVSILLRGEYLDEEMIDLLREANISWLDLGLQTVNPALEYVKRKNNLPVLLRGFDRLRIAGISFNLDLIAGFPDDTVDTMRSSLRFVIEEAKPTTIKIFPLRVYPGTPLHDMAFQKGEHWIAYDPDSCLVESTWSCSRKEFQSFIKFSNFVVSLYRYLNSKNWFGREAEYRRLEFFDECYATVEPFRFSSYYVWHMLNCPQNSYDTDMVAHVWSYVLEEGRDNT
jgi:radical SAM superfamily enzyme YgiQ (UPF0313 family)